MGICAKSHMTRARTLQSTEARNIILPIRKRDLKESILFTYDQ